MLAAALLLLANCGGTDSEIRYCAVSQTISCYGNPGETESLCDEACALMPGTSSYDPRTDCVTEYGPNQGAGSSCEQAIHDLEVNSMAQHDRCAANADDPPCTSCAKEACCSTLSACQKDEFCQALTYCLFSCDRHDAGCEDDCYADNPNGVETIDAYFACVDESCPPGCTG